MKRSLECAHGEAFALMRYMCEKPSISKNAAGLLSVASGGGCGYEEVIWNSRDGVTPFGVNCPKCGGSMLHKAPWSADVFAPFHVPKAGDRVFADCTPDLARVYARKQAKRWAAGGGLEEYGGTLEEYEEIRYEDMLGDGVNPAIRIVKSAKPIHENRDGLGYAGLRGLVIEFEDVA